MIILGVDPGYRNLGLSIVETSADEQSAKVRHSTNVSVGKVTAPLMFARFLWPKLDDLNKKFGPIEGIASETPPFIMGQIKTTAFLWAVSSIIVSWAHVNGVPFKHSSPISLKRAVCSILGRVWSRKDIPKKADVRAAVVALVGDVAKGTTSHENDATLAAILMFSDMVGNSNEPT